MAGTARSLLESVRSGRIVSRSALRAAYRALARRLHPDAGAAPPGAAPPGAAARGAAPSHEAFLALRRDYEAAVAALAERGSAAAQGGAAAGDKAPPTAGGPPRRDSPPRPSTREEIIACFLELEASGFPVDARIRGASPLYLERLTRMARLCAAWPGAAEGEATGAGAAAPAPGAGGALPGFREAEEELYRLRAEGIVMNELFGRIRLIFYNVAAWHSCGLETQRRAARKWQGEIDGELGDRGFRALRAFLAWLVADMKNPPLNLP